jgi:hypothetical protein
MSAEGLDSSSKPSTLSKLVLPDAPPGDPPLHHVAVKYRESLEKVMAGQWLVVANGGLPSAAEAIIDFPLDRLPPLPDPSDPSFASRLEIVLKHQTQNERNELNEHHPFGIQLALLCCGPRMRKESARTRTADHGDL